MIVSPARTRVLLALIAVYRRDGRVTVRDVAAVTGHASTNTVHGHLLGLRDMGLVEWEPGHSGTLRPAVTVVRTHVLSPASLGENLGGGRAALTADPQADASPHCKEHTST